MASLPTTMDHSENAVVDVLVDARWLAGHLDDPAVRIVEVDVSPVAYEQGHIAGAVLWNVYQDLKDADYQLVDRATTEALVSRSGITPDSTVVFYGYAPAMAFWLLKLYGHRDVRILDCSRDAWTAQQGLWTTDVVLPVPSRYPLPDQDDRIRVDHSAVWAAIGDPATTLLDVRSEAEFRGERFWPSGGLEPGGRAGHIPSAVNFGVDDLYGPDGRIRDLTELRDLFAGSGLTQSGAVISYCTIGGRACTVWFVLTYLLGYEKARVYDGSWAEWGRLPAVPIESSTNL